MALGWRVRGSGAELSWVFGVPSARKTKRGIRWTIRTPKRLQKLGLPVEVEVGVGEGNIEGLKDPSDLASSFGKAVSNLSSGGYEVYLLKVLPESEIMRLIRGSLKPEKPPRRRILPLYVKLDGRLEGVELVRSGRRVHAAFGRESVPAEGSAWRIMAGPEQAVVPLIKRELERRGFKVLLVRQKRRKKKPEPENKPKDKLYSVPWDFIINASKFILAKSREEIVRNVLPYLAQAPSDRRGYILERMDNMRMALSGILDPRLKHCVQVRFKELKPWLMPRSRCENLDKFKRSLESLMRAFFLEPYNLKPGTVQKCIKWWLYQDALFYLKRLLESEGIVQREPPKSLPKSPLEHGGPAEATASRSCASEGSAGSSHEGQC